MPWFRRARVILALVFGWATLPAFTEPTIYPLQPRAQQQVLVRLGTGAINQAAGPGNWDYDPSQVSITMTGNRVVLSLRLTFSDFSATVPSHNLEVPLGSFPSGSYEVLVTGTYPATGKTISFPLLAFNVASQAVQPSFDVSGMWWSSSESGWGLSVVSNGATIFATWFVYGADGNATWYSLTPGTWSATAGAFTGSIIKTNGPDITTVPFNAGLVSRTIVGTGSLSFGSDGRGRLVWTLDGQTVTKDLERFFF